MQNPANSDSAQFTRRTFLKSSGLMVAGLSVADYGFAALQGFVVNISLISRSYRKQRLSIKE